MDGGNGDGGTSSSLRFTMIDCVPDVTAGANLEDGDPATCTFRVEGPSGGMATLSCLDQNGADLDCGATSNTTLQPFGSNPLPIIGFFEVDTTGLTGTTLSVTWVADDGQDRAMHLYQGTIVPATNVPPVVGVTCNNDSDGDVSVAAGGLLTCTLQIADADGDTVAWSYTQTAGSSPANAPTPLGSAGRAPLSATWTWQTQANESGSRTFRFNVTDLVAPPVTFDLDVTVN